MPGDHSEGVTPGPIPNPEVKPFVADDTRKGKVGVSRLTFTYTLRVLVKVGPKPKGFGPFFYLISFGD